eukprot:887849-Amphidinium_carterae.3
MGLMLVLFWDWLLLVVVHCCYCCCLLRLAVVGWLSLLAVDSYAFGRPLIFYCGSLPRELACPL